MKWPAEWRRVLLAAAWCAAGTAVPAHSQLLPPAPSEGGVSDCVPRQVAHGRSDRQRRSAAGLRPLDQLSGTGRLRKPEVERRRRARGGEGIHYRHPHRFSYRLAGAAAARPAVLSLPLTQRRARGVRTRGASSGALCGGAHPLPAYDGQHRGQLSRQTSLGARATLWMARSGLRVPRRDGFRRVYHRYAETLLAVDESVGRVLWATTASRWASTD